ncbi:tautomerase family protein [Liquorilactobacillus sicerae]|uniref:tautomerase family protein n=1 Tax=Liquorilactobacillus sicerae TaxID=1416943 RepID=UPI00248179F9|nr:tautomerase family protein [Liquorilactobacillus sicerae]
MPLVRFDLQKGRSVEEIKEIMDITQEVVIEEFKVPERDRYQIVTQHEPFEMNILDTGLDIERSEKVVVVSLTSRPRKKEDVEKFYQQLAEKLAAKKLVAPNDLMVNITINGDEGWSFGYGKAQFLNGEL